MQRPMDGARSRATVGRVGRITGVRVLVLCDRQLLLVEHETRKYGRFWILPGGGQEPGETLHQAARREVREETGLELVGLRRVALPREVRARSDYALFAGEVAAAREPEPQVDLRTEFYLRGAAWHPVTEDRPLGPLDASYWNHVAPLIRERL